MISNNECTPNDKEKSKKNGVNIIEFSEKQPKNQSENECMGNEVNNCENLKDFEKNKEYEKKYEGLKQTYTQDNEDWRAEKKELKQKLENFEKQHDNMKEEYGKKLFQKENIMNDAIKENEKFRKEIELMKKNINNHMEDSEKLKKEMEFLISENNNLKDANKNYEKKHLITENKLKKFIDFETLKNEFINKNQIINFENENLYREITEKSIQIEEEDKNEKKTLLLIKFQLQSAIEKYDNQWKYSKKLEDELNSLKKDYESTQQLASDLQKKIENGESTTPTNISTKKNKNKKNFIEEGFQKIGKIFKPKKHKQEKDCIDEMSALNDDENENLKVNSLENENEKLDNKLLVKRVKEAEDMITFLQKTIEDLKTKVNHLQNALEKKEYELNIKKNEVMSLLDEIKKLTSQMGNQKELVKIIEKIREEKEIYKNESAQKSLEIEKYQENLKNLNEEHNIEREKHNEQKEKLNTTKAIKKDLKIKNKELEENLSKIQTTYNKKKEQLKSSKDFQKNYENLHSDYDNMKKEYNIFLTNLGLIENKEKKKHSKAKSKSSPTFSSPYDMIINIDSLKTQIQGWEIEMSKFALEITIQSQNTR